MQNHSQSQVNKRVYLDYNATTPPSPALKARWHELIEITGNPSSVHFDGRQPKTILREARKKISDLLGCSLLEIIFNSGASEGNSTILSSVFSVLGQERNEFLISSVEHPSIMKAAAQLKAQGAVIHSIPVNRNGQIDLEFIKNKLSSKTALVSVMFANNETGTIFPIKQISDMAHAAGALMHSDCVQLLGKSEVAFADLHLDYATFSAHKFYALKGTGFCYIRNTAPWQPLIFGSQERARRGGTENVVGIAALNIVLDEFADITKKISVMQKMRDEMEQKIISRIDGVSITAAGSARVSNTSSLVVQNVDGDTLLMSLDLKGFSVSTGAACSSGSPEPSPVLLAMQLSKQEAQSSLRVSLGWNTTPEEINMFVDQLVELVHKLRNLKTEEKSKPYDG